MTAETLTPPKIFWKLFHQLKRLEEGSKPINDNPGAYKDSWQIAFHYLVELRVAYTKQGGEKTDSKGRPRRSILAVVNLE